jgi:hypothetical protein
MFCLGLRIYEDITKVAHNELVKVGFQDMRHLAHESSRSIGETKWHNCKFIQSIPGLEGGLVGVIRVDKALVVARPQVQGGEVLSSMEMVKESRGQGKRSTVLDGLCIQRAVVNAQAKGSIRFPSKEDRSTVFRGARYVPSFFKVDLQLLVELVCFFQLGRAHTVETVGWWQRTRLKVDTVTVAIKSIQKVCIYS